MTDAAPKQNKVFTLLLCVYVAAIPLVKSTSIVDPTMLSRQLWLSIFVLIFSALLFFKRRNFQFAIQPVYFILVVMLAVFYSASLFIAYNLPEAYFSISRMLL